MPFFVSKVLKLLSSIWLSSTIVFHPKYAYIYKSFIFSWCVKGVDSLHCVNTCELFLFLYIYFFGTFIHFTHLILVDGYNNKNSTTITTPNKPEWTARNINKQTWWWCSRSSRTRTMESQYSHYIVIVIIYLT